MFPTIIIVLAVVGWLLPSFLVAWAASQRGRGGAAWFFVSFSCSPVAALLALMATPRLRKPSQTIESLPEEEEKDAESGSGDEEKEIERMTEEEERAASIVLERAIWGGDEPKEPPKNSPRKGKR